MTEDNNEHQRPSKMIGVVFPKAKYGVIAAIIIIIGGNLIYYLVRDINSPIYFHQSTNMFLTKFGVMIISMML